MSNYQYKNFKILEISGVDTKKFLQGLTTADLNILSENNAILLTAFANLKGRIISLCFVKYIADDKLLLSVEEGVLETLQNWLKKYGMFSKVSFSINDEYALFFTTEGFLNHNILARDSFESDISFEDVQKQNILNKLAIINSQNIENFLPAELELDNVENVVSYSKGCYMGQEVIARMHYKAKLKKELAVVKSNSDIDTLDLKDEQGKPLANVVNKIFVENQSYMLVVFHKEALESEYKLETGETIIKC
ncbi:YgfZ/GcvT domain-containing protein [Pseudofrancisella aestuarii]|uniref:YgfZ/GcvT domain-containing protein n=1 Tax=Pseudofrancisella aestuarii TaxID=2670347 RepID=A0ABV9T935_9GAMM|nr:amino acid transporter [Pseudofrancisella aestuarii]